MVRPVLRQYTAQKKTRAFQMRRHISTFVAMVQLLIPAFHMSGATSAKTLAAENGPRQQSAPITPTPPGQNIAAESLSNAAPHHVRLNGDDYVVLETSVQTASKSRTANAPEPTAQKAGVAEDRPEAPEPSPNVRKDMQEPVKPREEGSEQETFARLPVLVRRVDRTTYPQPSLTHATTELVPFIHNDTPKKAKIREKLTRASPEMAFTELSLRDVVAAIAKECDFSVAADTRALEDRGVDLDTAISGLEFHNYEGETFGAAWQRILGILDLTLVIEDSHLSITTKDVAAEKLEVRQYPIPFDEGNSATLIGLITDIVHPQMWSTVGGSGAIKHIENTLWISQTTEVHEHVTDLLRALEKQKGIVHGKPCTRIIRLEEPGLETHFATWLVSECNKSLGEAADPAAKVSTFGSTLTIQSHSRPFLVYAEELINFYQGQKTVRYEWCAPVSEGGRVRLFGNVDGAIPTDAWGGFPSMGGMGGGMF